MTKKQSSISATEAFADLKKLIRREGVEVAYATLLSVCNDPKAPAPARATAATSIFRAAGLFDKVENAADDKPLSEMTHAELDQIIRRGERAVGSSAPKAKRRKSSDTAPDVFE
ncbi:hypothetical protein CR492_08835 [Methylocella silvestris]|uniref:Uncharacterized protein n=1 Tax=Methylocella silvestris TaxID=199596 RepID=A0A2J7THI4_METSI|nr:hypothetical protein CR492_08835 [Methylocella silvestris]